MPLIKQSLKHQQQPILLDKTQTVMTLVFNDLVSFKGAGGDMLYSAFISYSHADEKWARWLMRKLEAYRVPAKLVGQIGANGLIPRRLGKVFRDRDELATAGNLSLKVNKALQNSKALIVICSPCAAQSKWVNTEITDFRKSGRENNILSFIVSGEPSSRTPKKACFPPALLQPDAQGQVEREPLAADARSKGDGRERAFLKLVAGLLGVGFDTLAQRDAQQRYKRLAFITVGSIAGMSLAVVLAITAYIARNDAQRRQGQAEDIIGFMLGDLREKLQTVGRLDLMRSVDNKAISYFATLKPRDISDRALQEQARSLAGIGEVRLIEGNYQAAMAAFREAYVRTSTLYERLPSDSHRLFDLSQAQYWLGYVAWQQGRYVDANRWLEKYLASAISLAAMDSANFDWQKEVAYGHHNLAVLDESLGNYTQAEQAMLNTRSLYTQWLKMHPDDLALRFEAANVASWLGSLALQQGRLVEAQQYFNEQATAISQNVNVEPDNINWQEVRLDSLQLLVSVNIQLGEIENAKMLNSQALLLAEKLYRHDPENTIWTVDLARCHYQQARLFTEQTPMQIKKAHHLIQQAHWLNNKDEHTTVLFAEVKITQAQYALAKDQAQIALQYVQQVAEIIEPFWKSTATSEEILLTKAQGLILQGQILLHLGQPTEAKRIWDNAITLLSSTDKTDLPFARLSDLTQVLHLSGQHSQAAIYQERLHQAGYLSYIPF